MRRFFVCHAGSTDPHDELGMIGRVYIWNGQWLRSPERVAGRDRNPIMKLRPLWGSKLVVQGDIGSFTEVYFAEPPPEVP
ncbi:unnamed protein product [Gemmataceae bacterium]|nr:unnamed protein product [Gemmataceae bacterium]VTT98783.1 unnamed protein product [Gemmataceae bacterium]